MASQPSFVREFLRRLERSHAIHSTPGAAIQTLINRDFPDFNFQDASERERLVTRSSPESFQLGTGASLFIETLIPAIASAQHEVILVTCFWAPSKTLEALRDGLTALASRRRTLIEDALARGEAAIPPLRIRICLSSRSLLQKLFHPQSHHGYVYPPSAWSKTLGLPEAALLEAGGVQLQVKSLFFLPFSVMHPKFVIIDRRRAFVPSCNISWETWLEGCVELTGDAVRGLLSFYSRTWEDTNDLGPDFDGETGGTAVARSAEASRASTLAAAHYYTAFRFEQPVPTLILPSSSHRNPRFRPLPWQKAPTPPGTPLNIAVLQLLEQAARSIYLQTPNITSEPVMAALLDALVRGVDVTVVTNSGMMLLEQLVTAGTTTSWCVRSLIRRFKRLEGCHARKRAESESSRDLEAGRRIGHLRISYFQRRCAKPGLVLEGPTAEAQPGTTALSLGEEPVHSHLKLTLVDGEFAVLGSGNMDRASWYTSQELGIMFHSRDFCDGIKSGLDNVLEGRLEQVFDSELAKR